VKSAEGSTFTKAGYELLTVSQMFLI